MKRTVLIGILSLFAVPAFAQTSDPLPPPASGMKWQQTFGDEFNGRFVDTTKWNGQYGGGLQWCGSTCLQDYSNVVEGNGVVQISARPVAGSSKGPHGLNSGGPTVATAKFSQRFGYWSVRAKEPQYGQYDGAPLWLFPIAKSSFPSNPDCTVDGNEEIDFGEAYNLGKIPIAPDPFHVSFSFHDFCFNTPYTFEFPGNVDTSADFHVYGLLWQNDGSPHGSFVPYFDGNQLSATIPTDPKSMLWDNGAYILLNEQGQTGPPLTIDWLHVYQQVASSGTPTPTPTATATPSSCSVSTNSPTRGSRVGPSFNVTLDESGCGGNFNRLGSVEP